MRTIEASGKTIDEAIFNGLKELEVSIDEVEIDIVQHETKGILGIGAKPAIVKLTEREPEQIVVPDYMNEAAAARTGRAVTTGPGETAATAATNAPTARISPGAARKRQRRRKKPLP